MMRLLTSDRKVVRTSLVAALAKRASGEIE